MSKVRLAKISSRRHIAKLRYQHCIKCKRHRSFRIAGATSNPSGERGPGGGGGKRVKKPNDN